MADALEFIHKKGVQKFAHSVYEQCRKMYDDGVLLASIKKYLNRTNLSEEIKAEILHTIHEADKKARELHHGKSIYETSKTVNRNYDKIKITLYGLGALVVFLTLTVVFLVIREANR